MSEATNSEQPSTGTPLLADYLDEHQLAQQLRKNVRTLRRWRSERAGPPWVQVGRMVLYRKSSVLSWLEGKEIVPPRARHLRPR